MELKTLSNIPLCTFPAFEATGLVAHGFSTRQGGVSAGIYQTMNLAFRRDDPDSVRENYRRICGALGIDAENIIFSHQRHHTNLRRVTESDRGKGLFRLRDYDDIDGLLTNEPSLVLTAFSADCVLLFFLDPVKKAIALSHAGWRGTVANMAGVTVAAMAREFGSDPADILAGISPSIGPCCFEVGPEVADAFRQAGYGDMIQQRNDQITVDLWAVNRRQLLDAGLRETNIDVAGLCTMCHPELFFSHRLMGDERGSMAALLMLKG